MDNDESLTGGLRGRGLREVLQIEVKNTWRRVVTMTRSGGEQLFRFGFSYGNEIGQ
jgi:hypothetical protein